MAYRSPTAHDVETFRRNGVVCLRQPFGHEFPALLGAAIDAWKSEVDSAQERVVSPGGPGAVIISMFLWKSSDTFRAIAFNERVRAVAAELLAQSNVSLFNDNLFVKEASCDVALGWHQDIPYYAVRGTELVTLWIAADAVTRESGGLEYVVGSHLWGVEYLPIHFTPGKGDYCMDLPPVPDIDARRSEFEIVGWDLEPGDCVVHHGLTLHSSGPNRTCSPRRALAVRYAGQDMTAAARSGAIALPPDHPLHL